jgi:hypothetical protein
MKRTDTIEMKGIDQRPVLQSKSLFGITREGKTSWHSDHAASLMNGNNGKNMMVTFLMRYIISILMYIFYFILKK